MLGALVADLDKFEQQEQLGEGTFGRVFRGVERSTGRVVAIKRLKYPLSPDLMTQRIFLRELEILAANGHPGALGLIGFRIPTEPNVGPIIITPLMDGGTINKRLKDIRQALVPEFDATELSIIIFGITAAMAYVHSKGILHRDLKPDNVFLTADNEPVVADFGLSRHCIGGHGQTTQVGSPLFMAPEILDYSSPYSFPVDVYSYAITLYEIFAVPTRWSNNAKLGKESRLIFPNVRKGLRLLRDPAIPDFFWEVIDRCWINDPVRRPRFHELLDEFRESHAYVLPGADMARVLAYEEKVYQRFPEPREVDTGARALTPAEAEDAERRIEELLRAPEPPVALLKNPALAGSLRAWKF